LLISYDLNNISHNFTKDYHDFKIIEFKEIDFSLSFFLTTKSTRENHKEHQGIFISSFVLFVWTLSP